MNKLLTVFTALLSLSALSQEFEIPTKKNPYHDIIEWKGMGAILMSKDPNGATKQINLTLVGNQQTSIWDQKFNPKDPEFYYLSSENARYVYFMDNLDLVNGKTYFSQLNSAGNVKSTSVAISSAIKKLGSYDYNKLELINIVVTDKALVHHFRYTDKKDKSIREFVTFITHHNFLCYPVELGAIKAADLKSRKSGQWNYVGFTGDKIYFAARDTDSSKEGWVIKAFTSKGKLVEEDFLKSPKGLIPVENIGFGTTGRYYLGGKPGVETGILSQINGKYYMMGGQRKDAGASIVLFEYKEDEWKELNHTNLNYFLENKNLKLGVYPMNEGLGYHLDHNGYNKVSLIGFDGKSNSPHNDFSEKAIANPSSVLHPKKKEEFTVTLPDRVLMFDTQQLGKPGAVKFELIEK